MRWGVRDILLALGIALAAVVPITGAILMVNYANRQQIAVELEARGKANAYTHRRDINKESRCLPLAPSAKQECIAKEEETARQAQHDEYDLEAQRTSAIWTRYMGFAAIFGTAFGILGVALVLLTLRENKRAADAAHDANRPWVEGEKPTDIDMTFTASGVDLSAHVGLVNHGNSPATNVLVRASLSVVSLKDSGVGIGDDVRMAKVKTIPSSRIEAALDEWEKTHRSAGAIVYPQKPSLGLVTAKLSIDQIRAAEGNPPTPRVHFLTVGVSYRYGSKLGRTVNAYLLVVTGHDRLVMPPYNVADNMTELVGDGYVELIETGEGYAT